MKTYLLSLLLLLFSILLPYPTFTQSFTDISSAAGITAYHSNPQLMGGGVAVFDYDNDGFEDIYMTGGLELDKLYKNNGNGTFTDVLLTAGLFNLAFELTSGVVTGDIDNDGDRDLFVTSYVPAVGNFLYLNNGNGTFTEITSSAGITHQAWSLAASMGDYNLDGYLDIYVGNYVETPGGLYDGDSLVGFSHDCFANFLYLNNGDNTFTEVGDLVSVADTGCALATTFTDFDMDRDMDIYIANDFGEWIVPNQMYQNNAPTNSFDNVSTWTSLDIGLFGMGIAAGDYDEDGDWDYYISNLGDNALLERRECNTFADVAAERGVLNGFIGNERVTGWGTSFLDYDNDTDLDLCVVNGFIQAASFIKTVRFDPNKLYENDGSGNFTDVSTVAGVDDDRIGRGLATLDYDNDGDLDFLVSNVDSNNFNLSNAYLTLYRNNNTSGNWLKVKLQGVNANRDALGAQVRVVAGGRSFMREVDSGGGSHQCQHSSILHFGLGTYTFVDSVIVSWPGGCEQVMTLQPVNQLLNITENTSITCGAVSADIPCGRDVYEPNNTWQDAQDLPIIGTLGNAQICDEGDVDWYNVVVHADKPHVRFLLTNFPADFDLEIYDATQTLRAESKLLKRATEDIIWNNMSAGQYYVKVSGKGNDYHPCKGYTLRAQASSAAYADSAGVLIRFTNVEEPVFRQVEWVCYPNPTKGKAHIAIDAPQAFDGFYVLTDVRGVRLFEETLAIEAGRNTFTLPTDQLSPGVYFLRFNDKVQKLVIE